MFGGGYSAAIDAGYIDDVPRLNFNSLWWALVTVYEVSDNENWNGALRPVSEIVNM